MSTPSNHIFLDMQVIPKSLGWKSMLDFWILLSPVPVSWPAPIHP